MDVANLPTLGNTVARLPESTPNHVAIVAKYWSIAVVGMLLLTREWSDWRNGWLWWIQSVYVRPEARRRGVFRALYDHIYRLAQAEPDVIGLRLYMEENNHRAAETYVAVGMAPAGYVVFERYPL